MAVVTLEDVVGQLRSNKKSTDDVYRSLKDFLLMKKQEILDNLEAEREAKSQAKKDRNAAKQSETSARSKKGGLNIFGMPGKGFLGGILKTFAQITAGLAAVSAGILGWRIGWFKAVKGTLKAITSLPRFILGVTGIMKGLYGIFGLQYKPSGALTFKGIKGFKTSKLGFFGQLFFKVKGLLNVFTKSIMGGKALGGGGKVLGAFTGILRTVFGGIGKLARGVGTVIKPFMKFLRFGGRVFFAIFKKILYPIGILISAFDGVMAFMRSTESNMFLRIGDGIAGFFASFIGMPLNLLRDITAWVLKKFGFDDLAEKLGDMDFVKIVHKIYKAPFNIIASVWNFMKKMFNDPVGTIREMWHGVLRMMGVNPQSENVFYDLFLNMLSGISKWWLGTMGISEEVLNEINLRAMIHSGIQSWKRYFTLFIPSMITDFKNLFTRIKTGFLTGFERLSAIITNLPALLMADINLLLGRLTEAEHKARYAEIFADDGVNNRIAKIERDAMDIMTARNQLLQNMRDELMNRDYAIRDRDPDFYGKTNSVDQLRGYDRPIVNITNLGGDDSLTTQNAQLNAILHRYYNSALGAGQGGNSGIAGPGGFTYPSGGQ